MRRGSSLAALVLGAIGLLTLQGGDPAAAQEAVPVPPTPSLEVPLPQILTPQPTDDQTPTTDAGTADPSEPSEGFCDRANNRLLTIGCQSIGDIAGGVVSGDIIGIPGDLVGNVAGGAAEAIQEGIAESLTHWVADGALFLLDKVSGLIDSTTSPTLDASWFAENYRAMAALAAVLLVPLLLMSVVGAVVHQDAGRLARTVFGFLPMATLLTAAGVTLVTIGLVVTDEMSVWITRGAGEDAGTFLAGSGTALSGVLGQGGMFVTFLGGLLLAVGTVVVWFELLIRSAAIYIAVLFLPLALAGLVWPATAHWPKRLAHLLTALIVSKFVIAAILALAASGLAATGGDGGFGSVLAGASVLGLAALSPIALLKLVPVFEAGAASMAAAGRNPTPAHAVHGGGAALYQQTQRWRTRDQHTAPYPTWTTTRSQGSGPTPGTRLPAAPAAVGSARTSTPAAGNAPTGPASGSTAPYQPAPHSPARTPHTSRQHQPPSPFTANAPSSPPGPSHSPSAGHAPHSSGDHRDQR